MSRFLTVAAVCISTGLVWNVAEAAEPWPGEAWQQSQVLTELDPDFRSNLSGAHWNEATRTLWVCTNGPGRFWALVPDGRGGFAVARDGDQVGEFSAPGDLEGITQADPQDQTVYVMVEGADLIRRYDVSTLGRPVLVNEFSIGAHVPANNGWAGSEGITFVPDAALQARGFVDARGERYVSRHGMGGLMFVAHQAGGGVYVFDLDPSNNGVHFVGSYLTNRGESSGLEFDRSTNHLYVWHNTGSNYVEVGDLTSVVDGGRRRLNVVREFVGPKRGNLEGIALSPVALGRGWFFAVDDDNQDGAALMWFQQFDPGLAPVAVDPDPPPAPVLADDRFEVREGEALVVDGDGLLANDRDAEEAVLVGLPQHGRLEGLQAGARFDGTFTYVPAPGFSGVDHFSYTADGAGRPAVVTIEVTAAPAPPPPPAPVLADDRYAVDEGDRLDVGGRGVLANDQNVDEAILVALPERGVLEGLGEGDRFDGTFSYVPGPDFSGVDRFSYTADRADGAVVVTIDVRARPAPPPPPVPVLADDRYQVDQGERLQVGGAGVLANDAHVEQAILVTRPEGGVLEGVGADGRFGGAFSYVPDPDFSGVDRFTYTADGAEGAAVVTIEVTPRQAPPPPPPPPPEPEAPALADDHYVVEHGRSLQVPGEGVLANDAGAQDAVLVSRPRFGTLRGIRVGDHFDGRFTYVPEAGFSGVARFSYTVEGAEAPANVTIEVAPPPMRRVVVPLSADDAPIAAPLGVAHGNLALKLLRGWAAQEVRLDFGGVDLPRDAVIAAAHVEFTASWSHRATDPLSIAGEATAEPRRTGASVAWWPRAWDAAAAGGAQRTPDLSAILQELVSGPAWRDGDPVAVLVGGVRAAMTKVLPGGPGHAAQLVVEYQPPRVEPRALPTRTVEVLLTGALNDVEERADGSIYTDSSDLELVTDNGGAQTVGLRFQEVLVPPGVDIVDAYIQFTVDETTDEETALTIRAQAAADAPPFVAVANDLSRRATTGASAEWSPEAWRSVDAAGHAQQTAPLNAIVQEIVDGPDYRTGNAMAFLITGSGRRTARASDGAVQQAPRLVVEYVERPTVTAVQLIGGANDVHQLPDGRVRMDGADLGAATPVAGHKAGLRFEGVDIPPGAHIAHAWIQFTAADSNEGRAQVAIRGEASVDAPAFTKANDDLGARPRTRAEVAWRVPSWESADKSTEAQRTPDLAVVVQEIVDQPGYRAGNAMAFVLAGSGHRAVRAYEGDPSGAPVLVVEFHE